MESIWLFWVSYFIKDFIELEQSQKRRKKMVKSLETTSPEKTKSILPKEARLRRSREGH